MAIRYKNNTENALDRTDIVFTRNAKFATKGIIIKILPSIKKNGAPGGCGTCKYLSAAKNSPQSQNETER